MGLFQKIIDLVKEELLDEPKKPAKKSGSQKASTSKPKGDSFEQLCAKAKSGDLAAQYNLYDQYADKADKREALEALFTEMMNNGDVEGKGMLACLIVQNASNYSTEQVAQANKWADEAFAAGSLIVTIMNGFFYACPRGLRRDWNAEVTDERLIKVPVHYPKAIALLEQAATKLNSCTKEVQAAYHLVYGYLAYNLTFYESEMDRRIRQPENDKKLKKYAVIGAEYNDPIACFELGDCYLHGRHGFEKNIDFAATYLKKAEKTVESLKIDVFSALVYYDLAKMYAEKGDTKVVTYVQKAAALGSSSAMANLSEFYKSGQWDLPKDVEKAVSWRNKAMMLGFDFKAFDSPAISF